MIHYNPVTDDYVEYMEELFPQFKSVDTQEELKNIFPLVDDIESFSDNIPNWVQKIQNGEFFIGNNWNIEKNPSYEEEEKKEQQIPDPDVPINKQSNQQKPSQQKPIQQEPIIQQVEPSKTESNQKNTQQSTSIGENRYNKSPLYEWDEVNKIHKSLHETVKNYMGYYKKIGIPSHVAAAIIGNMITESTLSGGATNPNDLGMTSQGLIQWRGERLDRLKEYAKNKGKDWRNINIQLEYVLYEMKKYYPNDYKNIMSSTTAAEASEAFAHYNGYAGWDGTLGTAKTLMNNKKQELMKKGMSEAEASKKAKDWTLNFIKTKHKERQYYAQEIYRNWGY